MYSEIITIIITIIIIIIITVVRFIIFQCKMEKELILKSANMLPF